MDTHCDNKLSLNLPSYTQLICQYDSERSALWYYLNPRPRPCFTPTLVAEIHDLQQRVGDHLHEYSRACIDGIYHNTTNLGIPTLTTISLAQGSALGGGFEVAL